MLEESTSPFFTYFYIYIKKNDATADICQIRFFIYQNPCLLGGKILILAEVWDSAEGLVIETKYKMELIYLTREGDKVNNRYLRSQRAALCASAVLHSCVTSYLLSCVSSPASPWRPLSLCWKREFPEDLYLLAEREFPGDIVCV